MHAELIYDGGHEVRIPSLWKKPARPDQMLGTVAERLVEVAGRNCYDSLGTGRSSAEFHPHLFGVKHFSVHEHYHVTVECDLPPFVWLGIPDCSVVANAKGRTRATFNLRHALEWPANVIFESPNVESLRLEKALWSTLMRWVLFEKIPVLGFRPDVSLNMDIVPPERDYECFVTLFLEDSLVWSLEQNRHRFNISQRSGRFCDQHDRENCIHPLFREFLNEAGYLALDPEDGKELFCDPSAAATESEIRERTRLGNLVGSHLTQGQFVYMGIVEAMQPWLEKKGLDKLSARKQARSAARYYLPGALSTEKCVSASIRSWRGIFKQRCTPQADAPIRELMEMARELIKGSRYGGLL